jgi:ABC-type phosphate transport system permease subunit
MEIVSVTTGTANAGVITGVAMNIASAARERAERLIVVFISFQTVYGQELVGA